MQLLRHPARSREVRHPLLPQVQPLPGVLAVVAQQAFEHRAAGDVHDPVAGAVDGPARPRRSGRCGCASPTGSCCPSRIDWVDELDVRHRFSPTFSRSRVCSTQPDVTRPARKSGWCTSSRWNGIVVSMPPTTKRSSARPRVSTAAARVGAGGRRASRAASRSGAAPSPRRGRRCRPARRCPGGVTHSVTRPGVGTKPSPSALIPALDRVAAQRDVVLVERQALTGRDAQLLADDVDAGDHLGDRVLHLDAGVHLEEGEGAALRVHEELDRARPRVLECPCEGQGGVGQLVPQPGASPPATAPSSTSFW